MPVFNVCWNVALVLPKKEWQTLDQLSTQEDGIVCALCSTIICISRNVDRGRLDTFAIAFCCQGGQNQHNPMLHTCKSSEDFGLILNGHVT